MQLIHLIGSIFRDNNIESSSCGMLLKIGFDEKNKICAFDLNANILDFTLPFSENGRSFSILHSLMTGAAPEIKRVLDLPERESSLNFFRKFTKQFDKGTKERFKLNDYEIWTRFHSLLNCFEVTKIEVIEILQLMSFVLLCNEASIGKKRTKQGEHFVLNKGHSSKKLSKNFCLNEEDFIKHFCSHKNIGDLKNSLISLMKHTYYIIFEFIKGKIKAYMNKFFQPYRPKRTSVSNNITINNNNEGKKIKYISFLDIPGEVSDQTLGGLITNLANECQNLYAGSHYMSVVEKLGKEQLNMKYFQPLHSHAVVESLLGRDGLLSFLSLPFTEKNFSKLQKRVKTKEHYAKCCKFAEVFPGHHNNQSLYAEYDFNFDFKFSQKNLTFNYEALYLESKSVLLTNQVFRLFEASGNSVIKSQIGALRDAPKNLLALTLRSLTSLYGSLENLSPFVIYCLHSNNSLKLFFNNSGNNNNNNNLNLALKNNNSGLYLNGIVNFSNKYNFEAADFEIPLKNTYEILRNSLAIPVLYWEWFGFQEWVDVEIFVSQISEKFMKMQSSIYKYSKKDTYKDNGNQILRNNYSYLKGALAPLREMPKENVDLKGLNPFQAASCILSALLPTRQYIVGSQHVLFRKNSLAKAHDLLDKVLDYQEREELNMLMGANKIKKFGRRLSGINMNINPKNNTGINSSIGIPAGNVSNNNINVGENYGKSKFNKNAIFNRYNARKMGSILNSAKVNGNNTNTDMMNNSKIKAGNYSRSHSINNETFNRAESLKTDPNFNNNENTNHENSKNKLSKKNSKNIINLNTEANNKNNNNEVIKNLMRRKSMKIQCHLEIININPEDCNENSKAVIEAKNDLGLNLGLEPKKVNFNISKDSNDKNDINNNNQLVNNNSTYQGGKYDLFNFLQNKKAEDFHNHSMENTHASYLESEYEAYKKQNNVIIPKIKYFNALKALFDPKSIESYLIFDYSEHLSEIRLIQNNWRAYKSRLLYKIFRYSCRMIVSMQKYFRGWVIRRKFRRFRIALRCIRKIQQVYRKRHQIRSYYATKIQSLLRMKMATIYFYNKLARKEIGDDSDDESLMQQEDNKNNAAEEPEFIYQTEYEYEEVEVEETDEETENENEEKNNNFNNNDNLNENNFNKGGVLNQNNISFSVDNSNDISVNFGEITAGNMSRKPPNPIKPLGNIKDPKANLNPKLAENSKLNKIGIKDPSAFIANLNKNSDLNNSKLNSSKISNNNINSKANKNNSNNTNNVTTINNNNKSNNKIESKNSINNSKNNSVSKKKNNDKDSNKTIKKEVKKEQVKKKKKLKKVMKLVKKIKLVPNPNAKTYDKQSKKTALERGLHHADIISSGFTEKYLKRKYPNRKVEKNLLEVSVSMVDRRKSMDQSSIIGKKWYFNNLSLIQELEVDKDKRQILDILMSTQAVKGLSKFLFL